MFVRASLTAFSLVLSAGVLFPFQGSAQAEDPAWLRITEPAAWSGVSDRGLTINPRSSIRIMGRAGHASGVQEVRINGSEAELRTVAEGEVEFRFFLPVADEGALEVEIAAFPVSGDPVSRIFSTEVVEVPGSVIGEPDLREELGHRYAVVVGISRYADPDIPPLRYADKDAEAIHAFLTSEHVGLDGYDEVRLLLNEEATYLNLNSALFSFLQRSTPADQVVVFMAAHGTKDVNRPDQYYILAHDTRSADIAGTGYPMAEVQRAAQQTLARDMLLIADVCHGGALGSQGMRSGVEANEVSGRFLELLRYGTGGYLIFSASQGSQVSREGMQWGGGHGVFTHYLLKGMEGGADRDGDWIVALGELTEFVRDSVRTATRYSQIPETSSTVWDPYLPMAIS